MPSYAFNALTYDQNFTLKENITRNVPQDWVEFSLHLETVAAHLRRGQSQ